MLKEGSGESKLRIRCGIFVAWAGVIEGVKRGNRSEGYLGGLTSPQGGRAFLDIPL